LLKNETKVDVNLCGDGNVTMAEVVVQLSEVSRMFGKNERVEAVGSARRMRGDKYDPLIASDLALGRALIVAGQKLIRKSEGYVRHSCALHKNEYSNPLAFLAEQLEPYLLKRGSGRKS